MTAWALVPLLMGVLLALAGRRLGRVLPPATAARTLTLAVVVTAAATIYVLALAGFTLLAQLPALAAAGRWSTAVVGAGDPLPAAAGLVPAGLAVAMAAAGLRRVLVHGRDLVTAHVTCRRLGAGVHGLVVVDDPVPDAYALAGFPGRIVVSTAMLRALPADERRILLAHEDSHLRHRHHLLVQLADVAAAADPLLRPAARAVTFATERWADEDAARAADRATAARALARAGLARAGAGTPPPRGTAAAAATGADVVERVHALVAAPPAPRRGPTMGVAALVALTGVCALLAGRATETRFEHAQDVYHQQTVGSAPLV